MTARLIDAWLSGSNGSPTCWRCCSRRRAAEPGRDRRRADGQYPESQTARRAAFERDKAALREIGVPIEQEIVPGGEYAGQTRYWIDRERYELARSRSRRGRGARPAGGDGCHPPGLDLGAGGAVEARRRRARSLGAGGGRAARLRRACPCCATRWPAARRCGSATATSSARSTRGASCCATGSGT